MRACRSNFASHFFVPRSPSVRTESVQMSGAAVSSNPYNSGGDAKYFMIYTNIHT